MPVLRSNVVAFTAGVAVGAVALATYPKWKHKVAPLVSALMEGAAAAFHDAQTAAQNMAAEAAAPTPEASAQSSWEPPARNGVGTYSSTHA